MACLDAVEGLLLALERPVWQLPQLWPVVLELTAAVAGRLLAVERPACESAQLWPVVLRLTVAVPLAVQVAQVVEVAYQADQDAEQTMLRCKHQIDQSA